MVFNDIQQHIFPIPEQTHIGITTYDAKSPNAKYLSILDLSQSASTPSVLVVLLDDVSFGASIWEERDECTHST